MNTWFKQRFLLPGSILILMLAAGPLSAERIDLDGVRNSGFYLNMPNSYLYVYDLTANTYAYQWNYGKSTPLYWNDTNELVADLADDTLNKAFQTAPLGNWRVESGGDPFNKPSELIWKGISLNAGTYVLSLTSDSQAYDLTRLAWSNETPVQAWNAYVEIYADYGGSFSFGKGEPGFIKPTEADALAFYRTNVDGMQIELAQAANVYFYINDDNSLDNYGGVSLDIKPVPEPGAVYLLGSGLLALALTRRRFRN
jgi:hypothetical protein